MEHPLARACPTCGAPVPGTRATYCAACALDRDRARAREGQRALWARRRAAAQAAGARDGQPALATAPFAHINTRGVTYYLHARATQTGVRGRGPAYFFAPVPREGQWLDALPPGYAVAEHRHNGVPYLRKQ